MIKIPQILTLFFLLFSISSVVAFCVPCNDYCELLQEASIESASDTDGLIFEITEDWDEEDSMMRSKDQDLYNANCDWSSFFVVNYFCCDYSFLFVFSIPFGSMGANAP